MTLKQHDLIVWLFRMKKEAEVLYREDICNMYSPNWKSYIEQRTTNLINNLILLDNKTEKEYKATLAYEKAMDEYEDQVVEPEGFNSHDW